MAFEMFYKRRFFNPRLGPPPSPGGMGLEGALSPLLAALPGLHQLLLLWIDKETLWSHACRLWARQTLMK